MAQSTPTKLSALINKGNLRFKEGLDEVLDDIFDDIYFDSLDIYEDNKGDNITYNINILSNRKIGFPIVGEYVRFVLNRDHVDGALSVFPASVSIKKGVLNLLNDFSIEQFNPTDASQVLNFFRNLIKIDQFTLANYIILNFCTNTNSLEQFSQEVDAFYNISCPYDPSIDEYTNFINIIQYIIYENSIDIWILLAEMYILPFPTDAFVRAEGLLKNILLGTTFTGTNDLNLEEIILETAKPKVKGELLLIPEVEFSREVLVPLLPNGEADPDINHVARLTLGTVPLFFSSDGQFGYYKELSASLSKCQIGSSGILIDFTNVKLDFSEKTNIPEASHLPANFIGIYVGEANISLPPKWFKKEGTTLGIYARNLLVGTGGMSGKVGLEVIGAPGTPPPAGAEMLFTLGKKDDNDLSDNRKGFAIGFQSFELEFQQNEIIHSEVKGSLHLPAKFDNPNAAPGTSQTIEIEAHFEKDGDFSITASRAAGVPLRLPEVFTYTLTELEVGKDDGKVYLETSGALKFEGILGNFLKEALEIKEFRIYSDGSFEIRGGKIPLPDSVRLPLGPVEIYVTAIHLGAHEQMHNGVPRQYKYFGFDGGVSVDPGGVDASGDGIKFYFTVDDDASAGRTHHSFLKIESLSIDLIIPGTASKENATLILQGYLSLKEKEYAGSVKFSLPKVKLAGGAGMKYNKDYPAF